MSPPFCGRSLPSSLRYGKLSVGGSFRDYSATLENVEESRSNRELFKATPVHPSILRHIQDLGVGKPDRSRKRRRPKRSDGVLDPSGEEDFLRQRARRSAPKPRTVKKKLAGEESSKENKRSGWNPPPPFASVLEMHDTTDGGHTVRRRPVKVVASVGSLEESFPKNAGRIPEVALAGRSNVGKSTLLNALLYGNQKLTDDSTGRKRLRGRVSADAKMPRGVKAVTSDRPGETKRITFYRLSSDAVHSQDGKSTLSMLLVDLPGYGFAFAAEEKAEEWRELMRRYILQRGKTLKRILLLIDARHGLKKADMDFLETLESGLHSSEEKAEDWKSQGAKRKRELPPMQLVLTKCDLVTQADLARRVLLARRQLSDSLRREPSSLPVMLVSAKPGIGFNNIRGDRARGGVLELQREIAALAQRKRKAE